MAAPVPTYVHPAVYVEAEPRQRPDGDTFRLRIDLGTYSGGVRIDPVIDVRLKGIDAWELSQPLGVKARDFALVHLRAASNIIVATDKLVADATLQRTVARVWVDDEDLADLLRASGFAKV